MSGATGVDSARVLVLGAGVVGSNAASIAIGMGAEVTVLNRSNSIPEKLMARLGPRVQLMTLSAGTLDAQLRLADAVIGAALVPGALAPKLVTRAMLGKMKQGAVIVDVSIDQGGCFETSRPTTHADPVYTVDGIVHYCVANMPGAVPRTSTYALNHATFPFIKELANYGVMEALKQNRHLLNGLNVCRGAVTRREVAEALGYPYMDPLLALSRQ